MSSYFPPFDEEGGSTYSGKGDRNIESATSIIRQKEGYTLDLTLGLE
jgi:hypothetical protein